MTKKFLLAMAILGLTFLYNPATQSGLVFVNDSVDHAIVLVDIGANTLSFFNGNYIGIQRSDKTLDKFIKDQKQERFDSIRAIIEAFPAEKTGTKF